MSKADPAARSTVATRATRQVLRDYLAYWSALLQASASGNPRDPVLAAHAASTMLATLQQNLTVARRHFLRAKGHVGHRVASITIKDGIATVTDCVNLDPWLLVSARTGRLVRGQFRNRPHQLAVYTLARRAGTWVVTGDEVAGKC